VIAELVVVAGMELTRKNRDEESSSQDRHKESVNRRVPFEYKLGRLGVVWSQIVSREGATEESSTITKWRGEAACVPVWWERGLTSNAEGPGILKP
jgi:hypothetical protein